MITPTANVNLLTDDRFSEAVKKLGEFVAIPSVSNPSSPDYNMDNLVKAADFANSELKKLGFNVTPISINGSAPFLTAERIVDAAKPIVDAAKPTILLYAHYDVQPVERDKWTQRDPFVIEERDGRLYGRGASDDKGGIIAIITALRVCLEVNAELPNIKILFEGEEEYGSLNMTPLLQQLAEKLNAHALVVMDSVNRSFKTGTLTSSTRGLVNFTVTVNALKKPAHSGIGLLLPDPAQILADLIYSLRDPRAIPGFMDGCEKLSEEDREILSQSSISAETYAQENGMNPSLKLRGNQEESVYERIVTEPSISIVNMKCGIPGGGNSIQDQASCQIGIRTAPGQDPEKIAELIKNYLKERMKSFTKELDESSVDAKDLPSLEIKQDEKGCWAEKADISSKYSKMYFEALKANFEEAAVMPLGGALPLIREFKQIFPKMEIILPGVEDPATSAHSHNESQHIGLFRNSINALSHFLIQAGKITLKA